MKWITPQETRHKKGVLNTPFIHTILQTPNPHQICNPCLILIVLFG